MIAEQRAKHGPKTRHAGLGLEARAALALTGSQVHYRSIYRYIYRSSCEGEASPMDGRTRELHMGESKINKSKPRYA